MIVVVFGLIASLGTWSTSWYFGSRQATEECHLVRRSTISDTIEEIGTLACANIAPARCQLEGTDNKITFVVKEGETVEAGEVVIRFDQKEVNRKLAIAERALNDLKQKVEQSGNEIDNQESKNRNEISIAGDAVENTRLALREYEECTHGIRILELESRIDESVVDRDKKIEELEALDELVKKGFRTSRQRREKHQLMVKAMSDLERDQRKLIAFTDFEHPQKLSELKQKHRSAIQKLAEAKIDAKLQVDKIEIRQTTDRESFRIVEEDLRKLRQQLAFCEVRSAADGIVAYDRADRYGELNPIAVGKSVISRQGLFYLIDNSRMEVTFTLDETVVQKAREGQRVWVRSRSHPETRLAATLTAISHLAGYSGKDGVRGYQATVSLDPVPEGVELKPGVQADIEILVRFTDNVLTVPVTCIVENGERYFVFVHTVDGFVPKEITLGLYNDVFAEVKSGLREHDSVALYGYRMERQHLPSSFFENSIRKSSLVSETLQRPAMEIGGSPESRNPLTSTGR